MPVSDFRYDRVSGKIDYRRFNGRGYVDFEIEFIGQDDPLLVMLLARINEQAAQRMASEVNDPFFLASNDKPPVA